VGEQLSASGAVAANDRLKPAMVPGRPRQARRAPVWKPSRSSTGPGDAESATRRRPPGRGDRPTRAEGGLSDATAPAPLVVVTRPKLQVTEIVDEPGRDAERSALHTTRPGARAKRAADPNRAWSVKEGRFQALVRPALGSPPRSEGWRLGRRDHRSPRTRASRVQDPAVRPPEQRQPRVVGAPDRCGTWRPWPIWRSRARGRSKHSPRPPRRATDVIAARPPTGWSTPIAAPVRAARGTPAAWRWRTAKTMATSREAQRDERGWRPWPTGRLDDGKAPASVVVSRQPDARGQNSPTAAGEAEIPRWPPETVPRRS